MITEYEVTDYIKSEEYLNMRSSVGWGIFPKEQAEEGLRNSAYICCVRHENNPIAMARTIWDHGYTVFIVDVIVKPEYQKQGLGRLLMEKIIDYLCLHSKAEVFWDVDEYFLEEIGGEVVQTTSFVLSKGNM